MLHNFTQYKLGRKPARHDPRVPKLAHFLDQAPAQTIEYFSHARAVASFPMALNDRLSCCTASAVEHAAQVWGATAQSGERIMSDPLIEQLYEETSSYRPNVPGSDQGAVMADVLTHWHTTGVNMGGPQRDVLGAFAAVDPKNLDHIKATIRLFGCANIGLDLPEAALTQTLWRVVPGSEIAGGHDTILTGYGSGLLETITWGVKMYMTEEFFTMYCEEAYAMLSRDWLAANNSSLPGLDYDGLMNAMGALTRC